MTQILFTIAIVIVVLYGSKLLTSARAKTKVPPKPAPRRHGSSDGPKPQGSTDQELQACSVCGTYTVEVSPYGCPQCRGKPPNDGAA